MAAMRRRSNNKVSVLVSILMATVIIFEVCPCVQGQKDDSDCEASKGGTCYDGEKSLKLKIIAMFAILVSSMIGIGLPLFSSIIPALKADRNLALVVRILASGVILSTGFMHVLPDSWSDLTSECLPEKPWRVYPMSTFIAMVTTVLTMMIDTLSTTYFNNKMTILHSKTSLDVNNHIEQGEMSIIVDQNTDNDQSNESQLLKYRIVAQVLEMGIVVHSVVIGLSMGVSNNLCTIRSLVAAMCFHQLFEGMGLGGCILQAKYGIKMKAIMVSFFSATTPVGIALGIALLNVYNENSPVALIVVGVLNAISSGLLIYMALVDLLASDFTGPKLQGNIKLQMICYFAAFCGMGVMSLMAKWA